jgi:hypothetical protein
MQQTKTLYQVFLDLTKACDTLDHDRTMLILEGYGVGPKLPNFIRRIWEGHTIIL